MIWGGSMENLELFKNWLQVNKPNLAQSTIDKYVRAVRTVSNDMLAAEIINKSIIDMDIDEIDLNIGKILIDDNFVQKDKRGNHMYSCGIKHYRCFVSDSFESTADNSSLIDEIKNDESISQTEKDAIIKARIGQGKFRQQLFEKYNGACIVTGIDLPKLLIASHIKPWCISDNQERISCENGLLLCANYDRLFDNGFITFDKSGKLIVSQMVSAENRQRLNLIPDIQINLKPSRQLEMNLEYHQDVIFVK